MTIKCPHCINKNLLLFFFLPLLLSACLGGGGGGSTTGETTTPAQGTSLTLLPNNSNASGTVVLTALLKDENNVPLVGQTISFSFANANEETLSPQTLVTAEDGTATVTITDVGNDGGNVTVQAQYETLIAEAQVNFVTDNSTTQRLEVSVAATILAVGETVLVDMRLVDQQGIPQVGQEMTFAVSDPASLDQDNASTDSDGRVQVNVTGQAAGNVQLGISSGTLNQSLLLYFGADLTFLPANSIGSADGTAAVLLVARLLDAQGSAIVDETVQFFSLSGNAELEFFTAQTSANGQVDLNVRNRNVEASVIGAQVGHLPRQEVRIDFQTPAPVTETPAGSIGLLANSTLLNVGGTAEMTVIITDAPTTTIVLIDGTATILERTDTARAQLLPFMPLSVSVSDGAQLLDVPSQTDGNGQATFRLTHSQAENITLTVSSGGKSTTQRFYFGAKLSLLPAQLTASKKATLYALLKDANDSLIIGETISFGFANENSAILDPAEAVTGRGNTNSNSNGLINDDNAIQVQVTHVDDNGGMVMVQARSGELTSQSQINFFARLSATQNMQPSLVPQVLASGQSATAQARLFDDGGFPIAGFPVNFFQNNELINTVSTDENGLAQQIITPSTEGNISIEIRAGDRMQAFTLYSGASITLEPMSSTGVADGRNSVALTVILRDANDIGIGEKLINLRLNSGSAMLEQFQVSTDAQGRGSFNLSARQTGDAVVSASSGGIRSSNATVSFVSPGIPAQIRLSAASSLPLSLNAENQISARVLDELGYPVAGQRVDFSTSGIGSIEASALTNTNGVVEVTFSALTTAGISTITGTVAGRDNQPISDTVSLTVQPGTAGIIEVVSIEPRVIGIRGSGVAQSSTLTFAVKDNLGNFIDGQDVEFLLGDTRLGGGEEISNTTARTVDGLVKVTLQSGHVAGAVDVVAKVPNADISTLARVSIAGGTPDAKHLGVAAEFLNIAGGKTLGLQDTITAFVGDRFGNVVPDGTAVNFISEGGTIGTSPGSGAFTSTTNFGQATAVLQSAAPNTPDLAGFGLNANGELPNPGLNRIVAYTTGSESFTDSNGNGQRDDNEDFVDLSEPYIDANDSNAFEEGELYIDVDGDNVFDAGDGEFQNNTTIWTSMNVLFSAQTDENKLQLVKNNDCSVMQLINIQDVYDNPLVSGTKIEITASAGTLVGTTSIELTDQQTSIPPLEFSLVWEGSGNITDSRVQGSITTSTDINVAPGNNGHVDSNLVICPRP